MPYAGGEEPTPRRPSSVARRCAPSIPPWFSPRRASRRRAHEPGTPTMPPWTGVAPDVRVPRRGVPRSRQRRTTPDRDWRAAFSFAVVLDSAALARPSTTGADAASLDVLPRQVEASRSRCASRRTSSPTMRGAHRHGARPATSRAACSCVAISRRRSTALLNRCAYLDPILALLAAMLHASEHANRNTPACRHGLGVLTRSPRPRMGIPRGWGACFARGHRREADGSPSTGFTGPAAPARSARCRTTPDRD